MKNTKANTEKYLPQKAHEFAIVWKFDKAGEFKKTKWNMHPGKQKSSK